MAEFIEMVKWHVEVRGKQAVGAMLPAAVEL